MNSAQPDRKKILENHPFFAKLSASERDTLLSRARGKRFRAGEIIFHKGVPGDSMLAVLSGQVRISAPGIDGREIVLNTIEAGQIFGEIALVDGGPRTAEAAAATDCELVFLDRRDFLPFLENHPSLAHALLLIVCQRLRQTTEQVEDVMFLQLPERLARKLLQLAASHGRQMQEGIRIESGLSQRELGNLLGLSRESINKQLSSWHRQGILNTEGSVITVINLEELRRIADG